MTACTLTSQVQPAVESLLPPRERREHLTGELLQAVTHSVQLGGHHSKIISQAIPK
ncbi:hypothetical protein [Kutzneria buriramensis]|uniref:hypothetical protein n=1 Tax=Kutzneria buriramensis TaxID=1045776 RepID=UPI003749D236